MAAPAGGHAQSLPEVGSRALGSWGVGRNCSRTGKEDTLKLEETGTWAKQQLRAITAGGEAVAAGAQGTGRKRQHLAQVETPRGWLRPEGQGGFALHLGLWAFDSRPD